MASAPDLNDDDVQKLDRLRDSYRRLEQELGKVIIGQRETIERLAICLFARGHALLMGVPGLAKTLLVSRLAEAVSLKFSRIQFTPDLMPMDITGTDILQEGATAVASFISCRARCLPTSCSPTRSTGLRRRLRRPCSRRCRSKR